VAVYSHIANRVFDYLPLNLASAAGTALLSAIWNFWQRYQWQQWSQQVKPIFHKLILENQHYGYRLGNEGQLLGGNTSDTWILKRKNSVPSVEMIKSWVRCVLYHAAL